ncbi:Bax inhibitor-1/YccA family protein, partial [Helicobacter pylori]
MALYDRADSRNAYAENSLLHESELVSFVKTTYKFFAGSLLLATIGALLGLMNFQAVVQYKWVFFIAEIAAFFGLMFS